MDEAKKEGRYGRILKQLEDLTSRTNDPVARMASICAVLHHKMKDYYWTGFYLLKDLPFPEGDRKVLVVGPYQGPVACQELHGPEGVCWAAVKQRTAVVVEDVHLFPGHVSCDSRSSSEITLPVFDQNGEIKAVFDVDSDKHASFTQTDARCLKPILALVYR